MESTRMDGVLVRQRLEVVRQAAVGAGLWLALLGMAAALLRLFN